MQKCGARGMNLTQQGVDFIKEVKFNGNLYNMGAYPAVTMGGGIVLGELFKLNNPVAMTSFDMIEGYGRGTPDQHLYTRTVVWVEDIQDFAWVYTYNNSINPKDLIPSGDWYEFKKGKC
jgi:gamma-glutamylcyclotransferase (GGCT)/AIG2-like uncharacterized protein YtfP